MTFSYYESKLKIFFGGRKGVEGEGGTRVSDFFYKEYKLKKNIFCFYYESKFIFFLCVCVCVCGGGGGPGV